MGLGPELPVAATVGARVERLTLGAGSGTLAEIDVEVLAVDEPGCTCAGSVPGADRQ
jgi:hypothetical protein